MPLTPGEAGYLPPPAPPPDDSPAALPPGGGHFAVPDFMRFAAVYGSSFQGYRQTYDEALKHSRQNAPRMLNDAGLLHLIRARHMPVAMLSGHLEPEDEGDDRQQRAAKLVERIVVTFPRWQQFKMHLLMGEWYGRAANEIRFKWDFTKPNPFTRRNRRLVPTGYQYLSGDKIRFKHDGTVGVMVHATFEGDTEPTDWGWAHFLTPDERETFVVHRFEPDDADFFDSELAGINQGAGLRGRVYWLWWLKQQYLAQAMNYIQRLANGFTVFYYDGSNPAAQAEMKKAIDSQNPNEFRLLLPRWGDGQNRNGVERVEVGTASPQLILGMIADVCDDPIRKLILGQDLTSDTAPTGLGSGVAEAHSDTLSKIVKYGAVNLQETITQDLVTTLYKYNCPGVPPARWVFDIDTPNATEVLGNAQIMQQMGLSVDGDHLYEVAGLPKPIQGDTALSKLQPQAAAGVGQAEQPEGVPAAGDALPPDQQGQQQAVPMSRRVTRQAVQRFFRNLRNGKVNAS